jgi:hypothetical protein
MMHTLRKLGSAAFRAAATFYAVLCLCLTVEMCLCDPDPDNCGEHCHDCDDHSENTCLHLSIDVDDFLAPQAGVSIPAISPAVFCTPTLALLEQPARFRARPQSTAPPDSGGRYISFSSRLHPLS